MGQDARLQVDAIKPPDSKWALYKSVWQSCQEANIPVPSEVDEFFEGEAPCSEGVAVPLGEVDVMNRMGDVTKPSHSCIERVILETRAGGCEVGYVIDLDKLPADTRSIRVRYISNW